MMGMQYLMMGVVIPVLLRKTISELEDLQPKKILAPNDKIIILLTIARMNVS